MFSRIMFKNNYVNFIMRRGNKSMGKSSVDNCVEMWISR